MWKNLLLLALVLAGLGALMTAVVNFMAGIGGSHMSGHGVAAMTIGITLTVVVGCGITAFLIWAQRRQDAVVEIDRDRRHGRP